MAMETMNEISFYTEPQTLVTKSPTVLELSPAESLVSSWGCPTQQLGRACCQILPCPAEA